MKGLEEEEEEAALTVLTNVRSTKEQEAAPPFQNQEAETKRRKLGWKWISTGTQC